jgi:hypothetical protein
MHLWKRQKYPKSGQITTGHLRKIMPRFPGDYEGYGGNIPHFDLDTHYPACADGCRWFARLMDLPGYGVCTNPKSHRCAVLTFEAMAGSDCFEA